MWPREQAGRLLAGQTPPPLTCASSGVLRWPRAAAAGQVVSQLCPPLPLVLKHLPLPPGRAGGVTGSAAPRSSAAGLLYLLAAAGLQLERLGQRPRASLLLPPTLSLSLRRQLQQPLLLQTMREPAQSGACAAATWSTHSPPPLPPLPPPAPAAALQRLPAVAPAAP